MRWMVDFLTWNGRTGKDSQILPWESSEIDPNAVHPAPPANELFPTKAMADKWAEERYPVVLAEEADRLRDVTVESYQANRGLKERVDFLASEAQKRATTEKSSAGKRA